MAASGDRWQAAGDRAWLAALAALTALAAVLRFWAIGDQSYWLDESFTVDIVSGSLGHVLSTVPETESTPPLYYLLAWLWAQLFGTGEAGLRSLSALFGVATVPVAYLAGRELWDRRAGLFAAALFAVNPYFVWYGQEVRAYALLVLLATLSLWLWARVLSAPTGRRVAAWAAVAALALATHYFAAFLLVPEAVWLVWKARSGAVVRGVGAVALAGLALAPLALYQSSTGHLDFIAENSFGNRLGELPKKFLTGEMGTDVPAIGVLAALAVAGAAAALLLRGAERDRHTAALVLGLAAAAIAVPLVITIAGPDYFLPRNLIAAYVPLALVIGAGCAAAGRLGFAAAGVLAVVGVVVTADVVRDPALQRDDWRGAAEALGPPTQRRVIVLTSDAQKNPLQLYAGPMKRMGPHGVLVREVAVIGNARPPRYAPQPIPPGFRETERKRTDSYEFVRYVADTPLPLTPGTAAPSRLGQKTAAILVQQP